jgi:alcohol dehydrogenase
MPPKTLIGAGCLQKLKNELIREGIQKFLLVTDKFWSTAAETQEMISRLESSNIAITVFDKVSPNPTISQVSEGVRLYLENRCAGIISLGGGSPHDCAKGIKLTILKQDAVKGLDPFLVAINTTAGTASEMTRVAIITDESAHYKLTIVDEKIIPNIAVDDPYLMRDMPKPLTAATGMDALTHAIEAYVSKGSNPITEINAVGAIKLIHKHLYEAYINGKNIEAREGMAYAQYIAGMSFSNAGLGLVHAMAHQLGGLYNLPHGVCNAVLLPYVIEFNRSKSADKYGELAQAIDLCSHTLPGAVASKRFISYIVQLNRKLNIPKSLKELGIKKEDCLKLAEMVLKDPAWRSNPAESTKEQLKALYEEAYEGKLNI